MRTLSFGILILAIIIPIQSYADVYIDLTTEKSDYLYGDIVKLIGHINRAESDIPIRIDITNWEDTPLKSFTVVTDENGNFELYLDTNEPPWEFWVGYKVYGKAENETSNVPYTNFMLDPNLQQEATFDFTRPVVIVPKPIVIDSAVPITVDYSAKAVDDVDGVIDVVCDPPSGSIFPVGLTWVECYGIDSSGNKKSESFSIQILDRDPSLNIPVWVKDVASFWVNDEIDDDGFVQVIDYLIENKVIIVSMPEVVENPTTGIPSWIKTNTEFWVNSQITDAEFATGIEWLIQNGIIQV